MRLQLQLDLGFGAEEEGGDFYNPDGIKEGEGEGGSLERREGRVRVAEDKLSASGVVAQGGRDWAYLHSPSSSPACAGDLVEIIADSTFYSIPKAPKEGVNPKGNLLPPSPALVLLLFLGRTLCRGPVSFLLRRSSPCSPLSPPPPPASGFQGTVTMLKFTARNGVTCSANRPVVVKVGKEGEEARL